MTDILDVRLYDKSIGSLVRLSNNGIFFDFHEDYLNSSNRPTLGQTYEIDSDRQRSKNHRVYRGRLPPFFSNLLPEGQLKKHIQSKFSLKDHNEFELLALLGNDLSGAVQVFPEAGEVSKLDYRLDDKDPFMNSSLSGVQMKLSANGTLDSRLTIPVDGSSGNWIVKFPTKDHSGLVENEYGVMQLAKSIGIEVPEIRIIEKSELKELFQGFFLPYEKAFAIQRFDRSIQSEKVHIEDFAQVFGNYPEKKYKNVSNENILQIVLDRAGEEQALEFIRRLAFNVLVGNGDMHLKNWSFIYRDKIKPILSPAYDFLSTLPYLPDDGLALSLNKNKVFQKVSFECFAKMADRVDMSRSMVKDTVEEVVELVRQNYPKQVCKEYFILSENALTSEKDNYSFEMEM